MNCGKVELFGNSLTSRLGISLSEMTGLDVGCGWGWLVKYLSDRGSNMVGIDTSVSSIEDAASRVGRKRLLIADASHIPFREDTFDFVTCYHVLEHIERPEKALTEMKRVLKSQAILVITVPNDDSPRARMSHVFRRIYNSISARDNALKRYLKRLSYSDPSHHREYTSESIEMALTNNGFEICKVSYDYLDILFIPIGRVKEKVRRVLDPILFGMGRTRKLAMNIHIMAKKP